MANEMRVFLQTQHGKEVIKQQKIRHALPFEPDAVYYDHFCSVTPTHLIVKNYFLPSKLSYEFDWKKILELKYMPQKNEDLKKIKTKGMDDEGRWWAVDSLRKCDRILPLYNIRMENDSVPSKNGFSVVDLETFLRACRPFLNYSCKLSGCKWSVE